MFLNGGYNRMKFLHISDIHFNPQDDGRATRDLRQKFKEYVYEKNILDIDEIFFTGDFRHAYKQRFQDVDLIAENAVDFLLNIADCVGIKDKKHIHIVPGNHDLTRFELTADSRQNKLLKLDAERSLKEIYKNYDVYNGKFEGTVKGISVQRYLQSRFILYEKCVSLLNNETWMNFNDNPIHRFKLFDKYGIIYLNTAIASGRENDKHSLIIGTNDFDKIVHCIGRKPIIILAHNPMSHLLESEKNIIKNIIKDNGSPVLWLCGDAHEMQYDNSYNIACITVGCMIQENGVEAGFHVGEITEDVKISIEAHGYVPKHGYWQLEEAITKRLRESLPDDFQLQDDYSFDKEIEDKFIELFGDSKIDKKRLEIEEDIISSKIGKKIMEDWIYKPKSLTVEDYLNSILSNKDECESEGESIKGVYFTIVDQPQVKTMVYRIYSKINLNDMTFMSYIEQIIYMEEPLLNKTKRVYFIDIDSSERDSYNRYGIKIVMLSFDDAHNLVAVNTGIMENNILRVSKKPITIEFCYFQDDHDEYVYNTSLYNSKESTKKRERKEITFITTLYAKTVIIDPETKEMVKRELFFDDHDNMWKANIKLEANRSYLSFQIRYEDSNSTITDANPFDIGYGFYWGIYGLPQNKVTSAKWLIKSDNALAYYFLSKIFEEEPFLFDEIESFNYMCKAAEADIDSAQYELGIKLELGNGCKQNFNEAFKWYLKAAEQGNVDAQYKVAHEYFEGTKIKKNRKIAFRWYLKAAENDCDEAKYKVGCMYLLGDGIEPNLEEALTWLSKSNCDVAKLKLGELYFKGEDPKTAAYFLHKQPQWGMVLQWKN